MTEAATQDPKPETVKVKLYNPNDGITGREGGPYLDRQEALAEEIQRAAREGREPDLENHPVRGSVTAAQLLAQNNVTIPSKAGESSVLTAQKYLDALVDAGVSTLKPTGEIEVEIPPEVNPASFAYVPESVRAEAAAAESAASSTTATTAKTATATKTAASSTSSS